MSSQTEQLEREAEIARTEVASSLDALREKLTPEEIVQEAMDYARQTRVGKLARSLTRELQERTLPLLVLSAAIAWACIAVALRSQRKLAARNSATAMVSEPPSAGEPDLFVAHEGWGVEVCEPLE